jgi:glycosyltransferase involved in cell wall biosynthesis
VGNPLRILHVVVNMNRGGAESLLMNLYRNMDRTRIQFDFLTCKKGEFDNEIIQMGGIVHRIPYISEVGHFQYIKELNQFFIKNQDYKIVHSHLDKMSGHVLHSAKSAGIPIRIAHSHNTSSEGGKIAKCYKWFVGRKIFNNASHMFACSESASKWLFGYNSKEVSILKNGIEIEKFKYSSTNSKTIREELMLDQNSFIVGHIGRFCHQKNHRFIIDIFAEIIKKIPSAYLILVGDGPLKSHIEEKVKKLGLQNRVFLLGVRSDVNHLLQMFDVLLFPSHHEGLPVTLIEAQGAGLPCVISDVITNEVDVGAGLIKYEKINLSPSIWAEKVINQKEERIDTSTYIEKSGYDIKKTARWIQSFYLNLDPNINKERTICYKEGETINV